MDCITFAILVVSVIDMPASHAFGGGNEFIKSYINSESAASIS